jgi:hypothetical protein
MTLSSKPCGSDCFPFQFPCKEGEMSGACFMKEMLYPFVPAFPESVSGTPKS